MKALGNETGVIIQAPAGQLVIAYPISDQILDDLKERFAGLEKSVETPDGYDAVKKALAECRQGRGAVEKTRIHFKSESLEFGRAVDKEAKRLTSRLETIEAPLKAGKEAVDDAAERKAREAVDRAEAIVREAEEAKLAKIAADKAAEEARLQAERKAEDERLKAERAELTRQREEIEASQKAERDRLAIEQARIAAEQRKLDDEGRRLEKIAFEQDARERAEEKASQRAAAAEQQRIEAEAMRVERERPAAVWAEQRRVEAEVIVKTEAAAAEAERVRLEALKPDVERIQGWGEAIRSFAGHPPVVGEKKAKAIMARAVADLLKVAVRCESITATEADKTV